MTSQQDPHPFGGTGIGALASAIAWRDGLREQRDGLLAANARGVMQVMPGTWDWVQENLAQRQLDPTSATDNVHAGTLYLDSLLKETGGDPVTAAAGYYQGLCKTCARSGCSPRRRST